MTREEKMAVAWRLLEEGIGVGQTAEHLGVSRDTLWRWTNLAIGCMMREERRSLARLLHGQGLGPARIAVIVKVPRGTVHRWIRPTYEERARLVSQAWKDACRLENRARDVRHKRGWPCKICGIPTGVLDEVDELCCLPCQRAAKAETSVSRATCSCGAPMLESAEMCGLCLIEAEARVA